MAKGRIFEVEFVEKEPNLKLLAEALVTGLLVEMREEPEKEKENDLRETA